MNAPPPRYLVRLRGGVRIKAVEVEWLPGRLRVTDVETGLEFPPDGDSRNVSWRVPLRLRRRLVPIARVVDVEELPEREADS